MAIVPKHVGTN